MSCDVGKATEGLDNELWRKWSDGKLWEWALLILQPFRSLHLRHSSFSNSSVALPTSQLILQAFRCLTYVTAHSPTLPPLYLHHSSLSNPCRFTYITAHSPTLLSLYLCHSSFSSPSVTLPTSLLILQPFCHFTYITAHSPTLLSLLLHHRLFTYITWRATHKLKHSLLDSSHCWHKLIHMVLVQKKTYKL